MWLSFSAFSTVIVAHVFDVLGRVTYPLLMLSAVGCAFVGVRRHRPKLRWPWWALVMFAVLSAIAGVVREATDATGDLSVHRSLLPDVFALPGYGLFAAALYGMLRARRAPDDYATRLDGIILGAGALLLVNELLILPTLRLEHAWVMARIAIAIYPAISMCLLVLASRLAFSSSWQPSPAFSWLLAGTAFLLIGDVVFALGDAGWIVVNERLLEVPYLLVASCIATAVLLPSMSQIDRPKHRPLSTVGRGRLAGVAAALLAPTVAVALEDMSLARLVTLGISLVLAVTAILRVAEAMKEQSAFASRLAHQATHDELTLLPNRTLIVQHLDALLTDAKNSGQPVALMFLDLDQFKLVNDSMGHAVGDQLLIQAGRRIRHTVRSEDVVGRISGDEFLVVAAGLDATASAELADRIRRVLAGPFALDAGEVFISPSIGIAVSHGLDADAATLIREADTAMYRSKDAGRNAITVFDPSMLERVARRVEMERRMRQALSEGDIVAHFQPVVQLPSGNVVGFETLARWDDDDVAVPPSEFIGVAEESGLIVPLGAHMLDTACRSLAHWRSTIPGGEGLYLSVNLSPRQVRESDIVDTVAETLARHGLPGDALWLEITESVMMEDSLSTAGVLFGLRSLGVRLSVDDFGTGYSSLSTLKRFPVSGVKIDRSFVSGLGQHQSDSSLVAAIVAMASALRLVTVAEGIETPEQANRLFELGCTQAQGYMFSRAVPFDEVPYTLDRLGLAAPITRDDMRSPSAGGTESAPAARRRTTSADRAR